MTRATLAQDDRTTNPMLGSNQAGMRQWNEKLVLSLVRQHVALPKAEIARQTGLSAQTVSVIMRDLENEGLLERGEPIRGKVGQPSVPMSLAAEGAFFLGLKIGRRSSEMVLIDFFGTVRARRVRRHAWPMPDAARTFARLAAGELIDSLPARLRPRVKGMGVATPFQLWDWATALGAPQAEMDAWRGRDLRREIADELGLPVFLQNDATAACGAELVFGKTQLPNDFAYFYLGFFAGGGIVLNGSLFPGRRGNAGALGSMPVLSPEGRRVQLIDLASIAVLERALIDAGHSAEPIWITPQDWPIDTGILGRWIDSAALGLAQAAVASLSVIDFEAVVIDGWMPETVRARLVRRTQEALAQMDFAGLEDLALIEGTLGAEARPMGAASLPLTDRFLIDGRNAVLPAAPQA
ncbi:MAG: ROK family transcriptional regulator [Paracoccaceae bacterium]